MIGFFRRTKAGPSIVRERGIESLPWQEDATLPIPQWGRILPPTTGDCERLDQFWNDVAYAWLIELAARLGKDYEISESRKFMMLSAIPKRQKQLMLEYAERTHTRVLGVLAGIAAGAAYGKIVMLILNGHDEYYRYIANYYSDVPEGSDLALSAGMYLNDGYGHFIFVAGDLNRMEPVLAHELTHSLLAHLPLPAWVNEGIAVNTERRLCPQSRSAFTGAELQAKSARFWNAATIQEFWSGKVWLRAGDGTALSYELAKTFVELAAGDWATFAKFVNAANVADAGDAAARNSLGYSVAHLVEAVLGPGDWEPKPERWTEGVERGQF